MDLSLNLNQLRLDQLQEAIRSNQVSFPSQIPVFIKHAEGRLQTHVVLLYFVLGWSCDRIAKRYRCTRQHIWQIVSEWRRHAVALGYLQVIPPTEAMRPERPRRVVFPLPAVPVSAPVEIPVMA
ncbi:MAG TPA: helix-turn-helix domain-containing protein [Bryobacteraceae bacterium]